MTYIGIVNDDHLEHHGVKGMKWGVRRYQKRDGSLTRAGKKRYSRMAPSYMQKELRDEIHRRQVAMGSNAIGENSRRFWDNQRRLENEYEASPEYKAWKQKLQNAQKKAKAFRLAHPDYDEDRDWGKNKKLDSEITKIDTDIVNAFKNQPARKAGSIILTGINGYETYNKAKLGNEYRDLSIAYVKDLGYSSDVAADFVNRLSNAKYTLIDPHYSLKRNEYA